MQTNIRNDLEKLIIFRQIINNRLIKKVMAVADSADQGQQAELAYELIKEAELLGLRGNILQSYIIQLIIRDENIFSIQAEKRGKIGSSLYKAVVQDLIVLKNFIRNANAVIDVEILKDFTPTIVQDTPGLAALQECFLSAGASGTPEHILEKLTQHYLRYGYGAMADFIAFKWEAGHGLAGVKHFDPVSFDDIIGYETQKEALIANTRAFVAGKPCNNVLLVGARGTGKSSSIKALANLFAADGLRLVEVSKHDQRDLHNVLNMLRNFGKKFILFMDDLSFEENESDYKHLKSILEGGVESKPANVLIYATSNRQHLIRETWNDRGGDSDDLHRFDTVHEKLSLYDRFGLTVAFFTPNQAEYFTIVEKLAEKHHLNLSAAQLQAEALKWEMSHSGRSGRTAQQLITHLIGSA